MEKQGKALSDPHQVLFWVLRGFLKYQTYKVPSNMTHFIAEETHPER